MVKLILKELFDLLQNAAIQRIEIADCDFFTVSAGFIGKNGYFCCLLRR
jgi:hypothetical protein